MLVANGKEVDCGLSVRDWFDSGLAFRKLPKRNKTTKVVLHWTGGTGRAQQVFDNLVERELSVHFLVDAEGVIWQFCDADAWCAHAGRLDDGVTSANIDTIGIEIVNHAGHEQKGVERPVVSEMIHGRKITHADFLPVQVDAALALTRVLCEYYKLPVVVPMQNGQLITKALQRDQWERHRGVAGHFHARSTKVDPGLAILQALLPH